MWRGALLVICTCSRFFVCFPSHLLSSPFYSLTPTRNSDPGSHSRLCDRIYHMIPFLVTTVKLYRYMLPLQYRYMLPLQQQLGNRRSDCPPNKPWNSNTAVSEVLVASVPVLLGLSTCSLFGQYTGQCQYTGFELSEAISPPSPLVGEGGLLEAPPESKSIPGTKLRRNLGSILCWPGVVACIDKKYNGE